jgi:hypothetical protein
MWAGFEIYVGLNKTLRAMSNHTDGMILIGDAAGLESTELCDGVPAAWFSAEIAAKVAIKAIKANDFSKEFLSEYDKLIKAHPIIQWSISGRNRFDLRIAQKEHNLKKLKKYIHNGWGLGALTHFMSPFLQTFLSHINDDPFILSKWIKMFFRYYQNWLYESYDYSEKRRYKKLSSKKLQKMEKRFQYFLGLMDTLVQSLYKRKKILSLFLIPLSHSINKFMKRVLPIIEPIYSIFLRVIHPKLTRLGEKVIKFVKYANPVIFKNREGGKS